MALARERGWACSGVEFNPPAVAKARGLGFTIYEGELEGIDDLPWSTFDLVTCWDCLEHTPNPREFAERLVRLTKPGGTILLTTLNVRSLAFRVFGARWSMVHEDHFTYWSARSLQHLFTSLGCTVVQGGTFGLGRDFVRWVDTAARILSRPSMRGGAAALEDHGPTTGTQDTWDVNRGVLAAERLLNHTLSATNGGVDILCMVRRESQSED
jgi:SAM-dependent methyltransferase